MSEEERLREYIDRDEIYQLWKNDKLHNLSDFDKFCIEHCKDIEVILEENKKLKQWDCNKDTRNSRQRIANGKLLKENQALKEKYLNAVVDYEYEHYKNQKAIEYIENDLQSFLYSVEYKTLLEILKGEKTQ